MEKIISNTIVQKIKNYIVVHKILSVVFLLIAVWIGYWGYGKITSTAGETRYVLSVVTKGTIASSVTGSGQVSASSQIDLKPSISGVINYVGVKPGDKVASGRTLFSIDNKDARKVLRDAQVNLDAANISLAKLKEPADTLSVIQYKNAIAQAEDTKKNQELVIRNSRSTYFNSSIAARPSVASAGGTSVTAPTVSGTYTGSEEGNYDISIYNTGSGAYFSVSGLESSSGIVSTTTPIALGSLGLYIQFPTNFNSTGIYYWTIEIPNKQASNYGTNYNSYQLALQNQNQVNADADRTIVQNTEALRKLQAGADTLDLQTAELTVRQKENALQDAKDNLSDYNITAPFDGTIASVPVNVGDNASSGTIMGTIITSKKLATISLNEVDMVGIKLKQNATLTFDAIPDLSITGEVVEIDTVGTVSQGVVTYNVKVSFDTEDTRVKPGMSVSASIITDVKQDVLLAPNSAIKSQNGLNYVEMFDSPLVTSTNGLTSFMSLIAPNKIPVEIGLSNDSHTEIISGIKEGDEIVTRTILPTAKKTTSAPSIFGSSSGGGTRTSSGSTGR